MDGSAASFRTEIEIDGATTRVLAEQMTVVDPLVVVRGLDRDVGYLTPGASCGTGGARLGQAGAALTGGRARSLPPSGGQRIHAVRVPGQVIDYLLAACVGAGSVGAAYGAGVVPTSAPSSQAP